MGQVMTEEMMMKVRCGAFYAAYALIVSGNINVMYNHICALVCIWTDVCMSWLPLKGLSESIYAQLQSCIFLLLTPVMLFFSMKNLREKKKRAFGLLFVPFGFLVITMLIEVFYEWLAY